MRHSDIATCPNLVRLFLDRADELGAAPMLWSKANGMWHPISWVEAARQACLIAGALRRMGLNPGDRVLLVSENRPEWCLADLGIMAAGCVTVPAYITNTERDHAHILENSGARAAIVSTAKLSAPLLPAIMRGNHVRHVIGMEPLRHGQTGGLEWHEWDALLQGDADAARAEVEQCIAGVGRDDLACVIYTSGTGGAPRGVRQHHGAILCNVAGCMRILAEDFEAPADDRANEVFLSFLPLSHAYEHTGGQFLPIALGGQIYYAQSLEKLSSNIEEARPTIMVVVPRLFEVLRTRIMQQVRKQGRLPAALMDLALRVGARTSARGKPSLADWPADLLLERTLRPKLRRRFGGRLKALVSGGAPLNPEIGTFFEAMGLTLLQGYGQTEAGPVVSCNRPGAGIRMDTVGPPLPGVEVRIAEDGELLVRGELVMHGYWCNEAATAEAIREDWLHTGDIGHFDERGRIVITDRKKDMIVNDKGDNVSPQKVESMLTLQPEIGQAMVVGDRRPYLVGLIVPDAEWADRWAQANGHSLEGDEWRALPQFRAAVAEAVDRVNAGVAAVEKVRAFALADEPFTITNEELTPSLKIRRHKLKERYGARLDGLYRN